MRHRGVLGVLLGALLLPVLALAQGSLFTDTQFTATGDLTNPPQINTLAKKTTTGTMQAASSSDTNLNLYVCIAGCGAGLPGQYVQSGETSCVMDETASGVGNQFVVVSPTAAPQCHRTNTAPTSGKTVGIMSAGSISAGVAALIIVDNQNYTPGSVSGTGVGTGTVGRQAYYDTTTTVASVAAAPVVNRPSVWNGTLWITMPVDPAGAGTCTNQFIRGTSATAGPTCATVGPSDVSTGIALTGFGINTSSKLVEAQATWAYSSIDSITVSGPLDDYSGCANTICRINGGLSDRNWSGLAAPATAGTIKELCNVGGSNALVLKEQSTSSGANNRFAMGSDLTLRPGQCRQVWYDSTSTRWKLWEGTIRDPYKVRTCAVPFGSYVSGTPAIDSADDLPEGCGNDTGVAVIITAVALKCKDGASTFLPVLTGQGASSILTGGTPCGCSATPGAWQACSVNGAPIVNSFQPDGATCLSGPCGVDMNIAGASGTTAALLKIKWVIP